MGLSLDLTETDCITCGVRYAMPTAMYKHQQEKGGYHHCPNGHSQGWSKDECELARLRRERDRLKQDQARLEDEKRWADQVTEQQRDRAIKAEKKVKTLTKRAAAGTCPCCQRTFSNMATHIKRQHPTFVADTGAKVVAFKTG